MQVTKVSLLTGQEHTQEIDVTEEQLALWKAGRLIQDVCPHLSASEREFLMTGATQEEWDQYMKEEP